MTGSWELTPRQSVEAECERRGKSIAVCGCIAVLERREFDDALMLALGGPAANQVLTGREGGRGGYWPRVWATRALLYAWEDRATPAVVTATTDDSWRVREMAAKVIAHHRLEDASSAVIGLQNDPVARVQAAAERAIMALTHA